MNFNQFDLFDMFAQEEPSSVAAEEISSATAEKEKKPKATKQTNKKSVKVADPVKCCGRGFMVTLTGKHTVDDCVKELVKQGYKEVLLVSEALLSDDGSVLTFNTPSVTTNDSIQVCMPVVILDGELRMELDKSNFPDLDEDEISIMDLIDKWCEVNPNYLGCGMYYDAVYGIATPVMERADNKISLPAVIRVYGEEHTFSKEEFSVDFIDEKDILESLSLLSDNSELTKGNGVYFVSFKSKGKKNISFDKSAYATGKSQTKNASEKFELPFVLHLANFGIDISLTAEAFMGKVKVTKDDVIDYLKPSYKMFSSKDRQIDIVYLKEQNILSVASISGKNG